MKKDAIIDLLENDLREIHTLVETFRKPERIASAFLDLLRQKHDSLGKEIALLDYWATEAIDNSQFAIDNSQLTIDNYAGRHTAYGGIRKTHAEGATLGEDDVAEAEPKPKAIDNSQLTIDNYAGRPAAYGGACATQAEGATLGGDDTAETGAKPSRVMSVLDEIAMLPDEMPLPAPGPEKSHTAQERAKQVAPTEKTDGQPIEKQTRPTPPTPAPTEPRRPAPTAPTAANAPKAADIVNYGTPVDDIRKALSINDRILFQRELFGGNKMAYDAAVETVNAAASYAQAYEYFRQTYHWDENDPATEAFLKAVHRRFL